MSPTQRLTTFLRGTTPAGRAVSALVVAAAGLGLLSWSWAASGNDLNPGELWRYRDRLWDAFVMTTAVSAGATVLSLVLGVVTTLMRRSEIAVLRMTGAAYVAVIRGTPLLVQIYFFYYALFVAWGLENRYVAGVLVLALFEGAYMAEIIRGGWQSIDPQVFEITRAVGLDRRQGFRLVTLPVLLSRTVPALAGQTASIIKDSSLLSVIAVIELTQTTQEISAVNFLMFQNYLFLGLLYLVLTFAVGLVATRLEKRVNRAFAPV